MQLDMQLLLADFGKRKGKLLSVLAFILHIKCVIVTILDSELNNKNHITTDSKIDQKNYVGADFCCITNDLEIGSKNYVAADSEIVSENRVVAD